MQLSDRLQLVYGLVYRCNVLADIGCDHGYLPIALVGNKVAKSAIAMDINEGPLESAKENILAYGLEHQITTRLSDGLKELKPNEAEVITICGMGGKLMARIIADSIEVAKTARCLVLEPQSEFADLRMTLHELGFIIDAEAMVEESHKFYPVIRAIYLPKKAAKVELSSAQYKYGPKLIEDKNPVLLSYLRQQLNLYTRLFNQLDEQFPEGQDDGIKSISVRAREEEIALELAMIDEVQELYYA